jgi:hypothetical protein
MIILGVLGLIVLGAIGVYQYLNRDTISHAAVGDCVRDELTDAVSPFRVVDCADPRAYLTVLRLLKPGEPECKDVAGAAKAITRGDLTVCMGKKDVDPATAVNVAKEGDCLVVRGSTAVRADCGSPTVTHTVLKRLTNVSMVRVDSPCEDVDGANDYFAWRWDTDGTGSTISLRPADVVLCLKR